MFNFLASYVFKYNPMYEGAKPISITLRNVSFQLISITSQNFPPIVTENTVNNPYAILTY